MNLADQSKEDTGSAWPTYYMAFRKQAIPSRLVDAKSIHALGMLAKDFPNAQLHFSQFVKVYEHKAIDIFSLLLGKLQGL
jgi:hypothetical protein